MRTTQQTVDVGDLFQDNDLRSRGRIVKVVGFANLDYAPSVEVEVVEHWNEKVIGRRTLIRIYRLANHKNRQTGYTKVSR
jgi:hypothetical protein